MSWITIEEAALRTRPGAIGAALRAAWRDHVRRRQTEIAAWHLDRLDDHLLRDIGIDRAEIPRAVRRGRR